MVLRLGLGLSRAPMWSLALGLWGLTRGWAQVTPSQPCRIRAATRWGVAAPLRTSGYSAWTTTEAGAGLLLEHGARSGCGGQGSLDLPGQSQRRSKVARTLRTARAAPVAGTGNRTRICGKEFETDKAMPSEAHVAREAAAGCVFHSVASKRRTRHKAYCLTH